MQGCLAGRIEYAGRVPTREEMMVASNDVMHDGAVRELAMGMHNKALYPLGDQLC